MSHSSDSFEDNCQILILVPRTERHNPCLKRLQMILPSCSWYSFCYITLPKRTQHSTVTKSKTWTFFCFFTYFRIQKLLKVYTTCSKQQMGTHALNLEAAHMDLCWGLLKVPSQSWEYQSKGSTPTKRTFSFALLGNIKHVYPVSAHTTALQYAPHNKIVPH